MTYTTQTIRTENGTITIHKPILTECERKNQIKEVKRNENFGIGNHRACNS